MTTITIDNAILEQAIDALAGYRRELGDSQPCDAEQELCAALAAQPSNYSDWQQRRGVLADIVDEALASYEAWMAEDDYNATDALHKIMDHMRQRAASYAKPAQQPAPAWHDAPTEPGLWLCNDGDDNPYRRTTHRVTFPLNQLLVGENERWYGPIPQDGEKS